MAWRVAALLIFGAILLPFLVFLRPVYASPECDAVSKAMYVLALERDKGTPPVSLMSTLKNTVDPEDLSLVLEWLIIAYSSPLTPEDLRRATRGFCMKANGEVSV